MTTMTTTATDATATTSTWVHPNDGLCTDTTAKTSTDATATIVVATTSDLTGFLVRVPLDPPQLHEVEGTEEDSCGGIELHRLLVVEYLTTAKVGGRSVCVCVCACACVRVRVCV